MAKQLFFDDNGLFGKENVIRVGGKPTLTATYSDGVCSTDYCTGWAFRLDDGRWRLLYFGHGTAFAGMRLFAAISEDGVHFAPETLNPTPAEGDFAHQVMRLPNGAEVAFIYEDAHAEPAARYKLLMAQQDMTQLCMQDTLYVSGDLLHWTLKEGVRWGEGAEPLASVFYNEKTQKHTVILRPFWGIRRVGYKETADWEHFSNFANCLNVDAADEHLAEIYGMYAFAYEGMFIGLPHLYRGLSSEYNAKYKNGTIDTQLAYSYDGRYWQRGLREPFISGVAPTDGPAHPLTWVFNAHADAQGIKFFASASEYEHGTAFSHPGSGKILIFSLRTDGFVALESADASRASVVTTREKVWHGGELHLNLKAARATLAVFASDESELVAGNVLGVAHPLAGYGHEDCVPFDGDSTDWVPQFKNGATLSALAGKTLVFEVRFENGALFSLAGDYTDVFNTEAARYRRFGVLPQK